MSASDKREYLSDQPLDLCGILQQLHHPQAGALVLFSGEVRNHHQGRAVKRLEYEAHEAIALKLVIQIMDDARAKWELHDAICVHRLGRLEVMESAVCVVTSASHRRDAYAANQYIIDRVKHEVPIWKKEFFEDGSEEWVLQCSGCSSAEHHVSVSQGERV